MFAGRRPCFEIQVRSEASECSRVRKVMRRLASARSRDSRIVSDIVLAVGEAFANAVKYGRQGKICLRVDAPSSREMVVEMRYPGECFDTEVTCPKNIVAGNGGFGRFIMLNVLDGLEYGFENGHTSLRMSKRFSY